MDGASQAIKSGRAANDANTLTFAQGLQRELANEDGNGPRATFTVSPLASLEDLCTTHDRNYVARYFEGRFTDVRPLFYITFAYLSFRYQASTKLSIRRTPR